MIDGMTETNICKAKVRTLESIEWTPNGFLVVKTSQSTHVLPSAAVKDSILAD